MLKFNHIWNWRKRTICSTRIELFLSSLLKCINKNGRFQYKWSSTMYTNLLSQCFLYFITPILIQACECFCSLQLSDISQNVCGKHHVQCANLSADCVYTDSWQPPWAHLCGNYWKLLNIATMFRVEMKQMLRSFLGAQWIYWLLLSELDFLNEQLQLLNHLVSFSCIWIKHWILMPFFSRVTCT